MSKHKHEQRAASLAKDRIDDARNKVDSARLAATQDRAAAIEQFYHDRDGHHVLRLIDQGQITADKGAHLIRDLLAGKVVELPPIDGRLTAAYEAEQNAWRAMEVVRTQHFYPIPVWAEPVESATKGCSTGGWTISWRTDNPLKNKLGAIRWPHGFGYAGPDTTWPDPVSAILAVDASFRKAIS